MMEDEALKRTGLNFWIGRRNYLPYSSLFWSIDCLGFFILFPRCATILDTQAYPWYRAHQNHFFYPIRNVPYTQTCHDSIEILHNHSSYLIYSALSTAPSHLLKPSYHSHGAFLAWNHLNICFCPAISNSRSPQEAHLHSFLCMSLHFQSTLTPLHALNHF